MKTIYCAATNDIVTDQRVLRMTGTLAEMGFRVTIIGRKFPDSPALTIQHARCKRYRMLFTKGPFFYGFFNIRLFFTLLFGSPTIIWSNDMDTLPACYLAAKVLRHPLVFDSHELFSEVPELYGRRTVKNVWQKLEDCLIPKVSKGITVCDSIARHYQEKYGKAFVVIRNVPYQNSDGNAKKLQDSDFRPNEKHLIYQGVLNIGRGIEKMILAMHHLKNVQLHIVGNGDIEQQLKNLIRQEKLSGKVIFHGRLTADKLQMVTEAADLGLSLEENLGLNYYYALPNKLFAYIQAGIPVLVSGFPEMKKIVDTYQIGKTIGPVIPEELAKMIEEMLQDQSQYAKWLENLKITAKELCWEKESLILKKLIGKYS